MLCNIMSYVQTHLNLLNNVVLCVGFKLRRLVMPRDEGEVLYHQNIIECSVNLDQKFNGIETLK